MKVERPLSPVIKLGIHNPRKKEKKKDRSLSVSVFSLRWCV